MNPVEELLSGDVSLVSGICGFGEMKPQRFSLSFIVLHISLYSNNNGNPVGIHNYCAFKLYANGLTQAIN